MAVFQTFIPHGDPYASTVPNLVSSAAQLNSAHYSGVWKEGLRPTFSFLLFLLLLQSDCRQSHPRSWRWRTEEMQQGWVVGED